MPRRAILMLATALLLSQAGTGTITPPDLGWQITEYESNPVISTADNPSESTEQYVPAPIQVGSDIWVYVKGTGNVYAWKSVDGGVTFTLENGGSPVIAPAGGTFYSAWAMEPAVVYDSATSTIHIYFKGSTSGAANSDWEWGHATAPDTDPTDVTIDPTPILTSETVSTDLGGGTVADLAISDVFKVGSVFHFYGYAYYNSRYQLIRVTGNDWDSITGTVESILLADTDDHVVNAPSVFAHDGGYHMFYSWGGIGFGGLRYLREATSADLDTWDFSNTDFVLEPSSGWQEKRAHIANLLHESAAPYLTPILDGSGRWRLYYTGRSAGNVDDTGLAYITP